MRSRGPSPLQYGLLFALIATLLALQPLTLQTYLKLFYDEGDQLLQPPPTEGLPVPRGLAWSDTTYNLISGLGRLTSAGVLGFEIGLFCLLLYALLRLLNPTFRVTTGVDWDRQLLLRTYMHTAPLIKAFLLLMAALPPVGIAWWLLASLSGSFLSLWARLALSGAAFWLLFGKGGVAGDYDSGNYDFPRDPAVRNSLLARGALAGTAVALISAARPTALPDMLFPFYRALGGIGEEAWWQIALLSLGIPALLGLAGGGLAVALGAPDWSARRRAATGLLPALLLAVALWGARVGLLEWMRDRCDYRPGVPENGLLAQAAGVRMAASGEETFLVVGPGRAVALNMAAQSIAGLEAGPAAAARIEAFLRRRRFRTALSHSAFMTLHDGASLRWDPEESLRVVLLNLARSPESTYVPLALATLQTCAATPQARRYAYAMLLPRRFVYPDDQSRELMGDIMARLGDRKQAEQLYRRAGVPETRIPTRLSEKLMFAQGMVTGRLQLDGRSLAGARVGLIPEPAMRELFGNHVRPGYVRPFALRWVSASTKAGPDGRFRLDNLVAGNYRLLVALPGTRLPSGRVLPVRSRSRDLAGIFVGFGRPKTDLGEIEVGR